MRLFAWNDQQIYSGWICVENSDQITVRGVVWKQQNRDFCFFSAPEVNLPHSFVDMSGLLWRIHQNNLFCVFFVFLNRSESNWLWQMMLHYLHLSLDWNHYHPFYCLFDSETIHCSIDRVPSRKPSSPPPPKPLSICICNAQLTSI